MLSTVILQQIMLLVKDYLWYRGCKHGGRADSTGLRLGHPVCTGCLRLSLGPCPGARGVGAGARGRAEASRARRGCPAPSQGLRSLACTLFKEKRIFLRQIVFMGGWCSQYIALVCAGFVEKDGHSRAGLSLPELTLEYVHARN